MALAKPGQSRIQARANDSSVGWLRNPSLWIFLGCLAIYSSNGRTIAEIDCDVAPYAAWSLVRHGTFDISGYEVPRGMAGGAVTRARDGSLVSKYPPGSTLAALPFVAPLALIRAEPLDTRSRMRRFGKLIASIYVSASVMLIYLICRRLAPSAVFPATLLAGFGTMFWSTASQGYWAHGPAAFFLTLALFLLLRSRDGPARAPMLLAGICLGMALLSRPTTGLFAVASLLGLAAHRRWAETAVLALTVSVMGGLLLAYNQHYFGNLLAGAYFEEANAWSTSFRVGLSGLLIAPSRGLLVYAPAFILLPLAFGLRSPRLDGLRAGDANGILVAWLVAATATFFVYARWHVWWGAWSFGPRFLIETIPILVLFFALAFERLSRHWGARGRRIAWTLVLASVAVHFIGVFGYHIDWMRSHEGVDMFSFGDTQIAARARVLLTERPLSLALPLLAGVSMLAFRSRSASERAV